MCLFSCFCFLQATEIWNLFVTTAKVKYSGKYKKLYQTANNGYFCTIVIMMVTSAMKLKEACSLEGKL